MKICNKMRWLVAMAVGLPVSLFAEGTAKILDLESSTSAVSDLKTDLASWVTTVLPYLLVIIGVFSVFWLTGFVVRLIKDFAGLEDDGYIHYDGMIFESQNDLNDYLHDKDDDEGWKEYLKSRGY